MTGPRTQANEAQKNIEPAHQPERGPARQNEQGVVPAVAPQVAYPRAQINGNGLTAADLLVMQRTVGNRDVQRMLGRHALPPLQTQQAHDSLSLQRPLLHNTNIATSSATATNEEQKAMPMQIEPSLALRRFIQRAPSDSGTSGDGGSTSGIQTPAQQVIAALRKPDPIAGVGDYAEAFRILTGLSMADLLNTLTALKPPGHFDDLTANLNRATGINGPRIQVAFKAVELKGTITSQRFAVEQESLLSTLPSEQKADIAGYLGPTQATSAKAPAELAQGASGQARIEAAIKSGWQQVRELDEAVLSTATTNQRVRMLGQLIAAYWTGGKEEEAIIRILSTTASSDAKTLIELLTEKALGGKSYLDELDRVVDLGNNLELHAVLSRLRISAMGPKKGIEALESAPILPWHDVMGFFEDDATFVTSKTGDGKVLVKYPNRVSSAKDFGDEPQNLLSTTGDIFVNGHIFEPDQVLVIHDYDQGKFVPVVAQELIGYQHAGMRGFLGHVTTVATLPVGGGAGAAKTLVAKILVRAGQALSVLSLLVDENRLNIVKWFPKWGPKVLYYFDLVNLGVSAFGIGQFLVGGGSRLINAWKQIRRKGLEVAEATVDAERAAIALEKQADELFAEVDKLSKGQQMRVAGKSDEVQPRVGAGSEGIELPPKSPEPLIMEPTAHTPAAEFKTRKPRGFEPTDQGTKKPVKAGTLAELESHRHEQPPKRKQRPVTRVEQLEGIVPQSKRSSLLTGKRPPLSRGKAPHFPRLRRFAEGFHNATNIREQERILELAKLDPKAAGRKYQALVAADLRAEDVQETFSRPGRRLDIGTNHEVTIEGMTKGFGQHKLDQLWNDLEHEEKVLLTVPKLSQQAVNQLMKLGALAEHQFNKQVLILVRETLNQ